MCIHKNIYVYLLFKRLCEINTIKWNVYLILILFEFLISLRLSLHIFFDACDACDVCDVCDVCDACDCEVSE